MAQTVKLLPHQARFVQAPYVFTDTRFFILCGGYACGKTSSLVYSVMNTIKLLLGKKDAEGHDPKIMVCSKNITFLAKTWTNAFEQNLRMTNSEYTFDRAKNILRVGNVEIILVGLEDPSTIYGYSVYASWCDELDELPTEIAMEAVKSVNDRVRQQIDGMRSPFISFATTSQGLKGLYQTVLHFKKSGIGFVLMRARTQDNIFLPKDYVKNLYSIYNEKERRCLLEGEFISIDSGLVFPDYDPSVNKLDVDLYDCLEPDDTVYVGNDFNSFGNAGVACVVKKGCIVAIKDYNFPDVRRIPEVLRYDFPTQKIVWIPDATATAIYTQYKKELRQHNIKIAYRKSNPLVQDRTFAINKLLHAQHLFICPLCKDVEHSFLTHQKDPKTGLPTKGGQGACDHISDAISYSVYHILCWCRDMKNLYDVTLGRKKLSRIGAFGQEVDADYKLLNPDKIAIEAPANINQEDWEEAIDHN